MAKQTRRPATTSKPQSVKTSIVLDADTHAKLAGLAAIRRTTMTSLIADAVAELVSSVVLFDRSATRSKAVDSPVQVKESDEAA